MQTDADVWQVSPDDGLQTVGYEQASDDVQGGRTPGGDDEPDNHRTPLSADDLQNSIIPVGDNDTRGTVPFVTKKR